MPTFLRPAAMVAAFQALYREGTITAQNLHDQIFSDSDTKALFPTKTTNNTVIDEVNKSLTSVLQPFYSTFSAFGALDFIPNSWYLDRVKINIQMKPDDLANTALDFYAPKGVSKKDAPIVQTISEYLIAKAKEDDELEVVFKGVFALPTAPNMLLKVPGATAGSRNGIRKKIRDYNTAGKFALENTVIAMGAVPTDPVLFVDYVEAMFYSIPSKFRKFIKKLVMSTTMHTRFKRGMRVKYDVNYDQTKGSRSFIIDTMCEIVGFDSHEGSTMIWATPEENRVGFIKNPSNVSVFEVATEGLYDVIMGTDWYEGYDFINPYWIWTNGQDL
jgi:hypothetical protein